MNTLEQKKPRPPAEWWKKSSSERLADPMALQYDLSGGPDMPAALEWVSGVDLTHLKVMPVNMLVENILPARSLVLASAPPKGGKSTFGISLSYALATGTQFLGRLQTKQSNVLYWIPDDANLERFARTWRECAGTATVPNFSVSVQTAQLPAAFTLIEEGIAQKQAQVLIVDSYTKIRAPYGGDFVNREYEDMRRFSDIALKTGCSIILIHHHSKTGSAAKGDAHLAAAGSFAMGGGCDSMWSFARLENSERKLNVRGRDIDEYSLVYRRDAAHKLRFVVDGDAAECWQEFREAMAADLPAVFSSKELAEALQKSTRTASRTIKKWIYSGLVNHRLAGFQVADEIRAALDIPAVKPEPEETF